MDSSPNFSSCNDIPENPEHVFFHRPRFAKERMEREEKREESSRDDVVDNNSNGKYNIKGELVI